ncbi:hypothetical protein L7F22_054742 [Adiantum nelumboides]|nr:hypothetical protein [Adiantum nelumboides]
MLQLQRIWSTESLQSSSPADFLALCITESSLACRATATSHRRDCQQRESALRAPLRSTQRILQDCRGDPYFSGRHIQVTTEIRRLQELRSEFSHHASVSYWISKADRMNRDFFVAHRERPAGSTMRAIRDTHGVLHTDPDQVLEISSAFYEDLFTADPATAEIIDAREQIWSSTHTRVTEDMCYHLMAPFTVEELHDAVHSLAPSSCPGDDGLTRGFFITHWDLMHVWDALNGLKEQFFRTLRVNLKFLQEELCLLLEEMQSCSKTLNGASEIEVADSGTENPKERRMLEERYFEVEGQIVSILRTVEVLKGEAHSFAAVETGAKNDVGDTLAQAFDFFEQLRKDVEAVERPEVLERGNSESKAPIASPKTKPSLRWADPVTQLEREAMQPEDFFEEESRREMLERGTNPDKSKDSNVHAVSHEETEGWEFDEIEEELKG